LETKIREGSLLYRLSHRVKKLQNNFLFQRWKSDRGCCRKAKSPALEGEAFPIYLDER
jgi:hypothetical protein